MDNNKEGEQSAMSSADTNHSPPASPILTHSMFDSTGRRHLPSRHSRAAAVNKIKKEVKSKPKPKGEDAPSAENPYEHFNCGLCEGAGRMLLCDGPCGRVFHEEGCAKRKDEDDPDAAWYCEDCAAESHVCGICGVRGSDDSEVFRCSALRCGSFFHPACIKAAPLASYNSKSFRCPAHVCHTCNTSASGKSQPLVRCVRCPAAFHALRCCTPGTVRFQGLWALCNKHEPKQTTNKDEDDLLWERSVAEPIPVFGANSRLFSPSISFTPPAFMDFRLPQTIIRDGDRFRPSDAIPMFKKVISNYYNEEFVRRPTYTGDVEPCLCGEGDECEENCVNRASYMECTKKCIHGDKCHNQRILRRQHAKTKVVATPGRGFGLFAIEPIKAGHLVIEYCGEVVSEDECNRRLDSYKVTGQKDFYMMKLNNEYIIDANHIANNARFINHSCLPNCKTELWTVGPQKRVGIFALKDIEAGTELTYDYNCTGYWRLGDEQPCLCRAPNCRKFLGAKAVKFVEEKSAVAKKLAAKKKRKAEAAAKRAAKRAAADGAKEEKEGEQGQEQDDGEEDESGDDRAQEEAA